MARDEVDAVDAVPVGEAEEVDDLAEREKKKKSSLSRDVGARVEPNPSAGSGSFRPTERSDHLSDGLKTRGMPPWFRKDTDSTPRPGAKRGRFLFFRPGREHVSAAAARDVERAPAAPAPRVGDDGPEEHAPVLWVQVVVEVVRPDEDVGRRVVLPPPVWTWTCSRCVRLRRIGLNSREVCTQASRSRPEGHSRRKGSRNENDSDSTEMENVAVWLDMSNSAIDFHPGLRCIAT